MRLPEFLARLRRFLQEEESSRRQRYHAEHERAQREQTTLDILKGLIGERAADRNEGRRHRKQSFWFNLGTLIVAIITMSAVIGYTIVSKGQWDAQRTANDIAERNFRASHRPWLDPVVAIEKPLTFYERYAEIGLSIKATNIGAGVAVDSKPVLTLMLLTGAAPKGNPVLLAQDAACNKQAVRSQFTIPMAGGFSSVAFPNRDVAYPEWHLQTARPTSDIHAAWITGCLAYIDETGEPHATLINLLFAGSYPFTPRAGLVVKSGRWGRAPFGQGAY